MNNPQIYETCFAGEIPPVFNKERGCLKSLCETFSFFSVELYVILKLLLHIDFTEEAKRTTEKEFIKSPLLRPPFMNAQLLRMQAVL